MMYPRLADAGPWLRREGWHRLSAASALRRRRHDEPPLPVHRRPGAAPTISSTRTSDHGRVRIAEAVIAAVARGAALSCYGVVALASAPAVATPGRRRSPGFGPRPWRRGPVPGRGRVAVELDLVLASGLPATAVARNVVAAVTYQVERALGLPVDRVDVVVSGLRVGADQAGLG